MLVNGFLSEPEAVKSGVPQGSVIGPLLFIILIGDINADLEHSFLSSFADDTRTAKGVSNLRDVSLLQSDLEKVYLWARNNNMLFNNTKLEVLRYGTNTDLKEETTYLCPDGSPIQEKQSLRDLGITMSNSATFAEHINNTCQKARDMCSWILRTFKTRSPKPMKTLWKSLVLPILDYCSQLWCPTKKGQIQQLEAVQQYFTRKIHLGEKLNYWERLSKLKLFSLQRRRERYRIIYVWKILEQKVPNIGCGGDGGIKKLQSVGRNGRTCKIPPLANSASAKIKHLREESLSCHGSQLFNALPTGLRNLSECTLDIFKTRLDKFLQKIEDLPQILGYTSGRQTESNSLIHMIPFTLNSVSRQSPLTIGSAPALPWH